MKRFLIVLTLLSGLTITGYCAKITIRNSNNYRVKVVVRQKGFTLWRGSIASKDNVLLNASKGRIVVILKRANGTSKKLVRIVKGLFLLIILK